MKTTQLTSGILTALLIIFSFGASAQSDCAIMQSGTFKYDDPTEDNSIVITATTVTEYFNNGNVVSAIAWNSDCSYTTTIQNINVQNFPYSIGDQVGVTINSVTGNKISITVSVGGTTWSQVLVKE